MKKIIGLTILGLSINMATVILAEQTPQSVITDQRIKQVEYQRNQVIPIVGQAFVNTQIIFGDDETILDVQNGDEAGWTAHIDKNIPYILNIKPTLFDSNTNLDIVTTDSHNLKRIYRFHLIMGREINKNKINSTYAIEFIYPDKEKAKLEDTLNYLKRQQETIINSSKQPSDYHWDYTFSGDKTILPIHIFDDGQFTYLQLRPGQSVPAVFAVNNSVGDESVVNVRREGDYLVIHELAPQFTLRVGKYHVASIFNTVMINKIRKNGED